MLENGRYGAFERSIVAWILLKQNSRKRIPRRSFATTRSNRIETREQGGFPAQRPDARSASTHGVDRDSPLVDASPPIIGYASGLLDLIRPNGPFPLATRIGSKSGRE